VLVPYCVRVIELLDLESFGSPVRTRARPAGSENYGSIDATVKLQSRGRFLKCLLDAAKGKVDVRFRTKRL
jgi:hypothetical protein